jgi:hypothetical protein
MPPVATSIQESVQGETRTYTVSPWPLDASTAFLCVRKPGPEFTVANPRPAAAAGCAPLHTTVSGDQLVAVFPPPDLDPIVGAEFERSRPPWYLAVAGSRGPFSAAVVLTVINSPIQSQAGPS